MKRTNKGFSLVELIVVIGILVIVGGITTLILTTTLRIGNKGRIANAVFQNGNYALSVMSDIINTSDSIQQVGGVALSDTFNCSTNPPNGITGPSVTLRRIDGGVTTLLCDFLTDPLHPKISSTSATTGNIDIIDTSQVQIDTAAPSPCSFTCFQTDIYTTPIIKINFSLNNRQPAFVFEQNAPGTFRTSVSLRNYTPRQ